MWSGIAFYRSTTNRYDITARGFTGKPLTARPIEERKEYREIARGIGETGPDRTGFEREGEFESAGIRTAPPVNRVCRDLFRGGETKPGPTTTGPGRRRFGRGFPRPELPRKGLNSPFHLNHFYLKESE